MGANTSSDDEEHNPVLVSLPDGRTVDIATKEGVNALLTGVSNFNYISSHLKEIRKLRKKKNLNAARQKLLEDHVLFIDTLPQCPDRDLFREKIPKSEIQDWLNYTMEEIKNFTKKPSWISSGNLEHRDYIMLVMCDTMLVHEIPAMLAFEGEFFQVVTDFIKARKGNGRALPHALICGWIGRIAYNSFISASLLKDWSSDKIFKKFEATGFLQQILRCSTVPHGAGKATWESQDRLEILLSELESCIGILTKKFRSGEPCGDTLKAILDGRDGSRYIQPDIVDRLKGIAALAETMDSTEFEAQLASGTCSSCSEKSNAELSVCSRCHFVFYCSKECQKADWERHKCNCRKLDAADWERAISLDMATYRFMNKHFETVLEEMDQSCARTGVEASDSAVEISFIPRDGVIPAFQDSPMFKIVSIRDYISGEVKGWFSEDGEKLTDLQRSWLKDLTKAVEKGYKSSAGIMVLNHAGRAYVDFDTIRLYRQAGSSKLGNIKMKLGTKWCSRPLSIFHRLSCDTEFDGQVIDSSFQLGSINPN